MTVHGMHKTLCFVILNKMLNNVNFFETEANFLESFFAVDWFFIRWHFCVWPIAFFSHKYFVILHKCIYLACIWITFGNFGISQRIIITTFFGFFSLSMRSAFQLVLNFFFRPKKVGSHFFVCTTNEEKKTSFFKESLIFRSNIHAPSLASSYLSVYFSLCSVAVCGKNLVTYNVYFLLTVKEILSKIEYVRNS